MNRPRPTPEIAVVIPTRSREARLGFALEALAGQTLERTRFEVIVVRSEDAKGPFAAALDGLPVRFLTHMGAPGPGAQRNTGWRATEAPLVAFTDDDCRPAPEWLARLLAAGRQGDVVVQGRTEPDPAERHLLLGPARSVEILRPSNWFETCNIAYPTALLRRLGGFDESFRFSAEDADLGLRARKAGAGRIFDYGAVVLHAVLPDPFPGAIRAALVRDSTPRLIARHPEHRRELRGRIFWKPSHARLLLAATGCLLFRGRPLLLALMLYPYVRLYVGWRAVTTPRAAARTALSLAGRIAIDATEVAVTVRGAARHRVLLL